jgi:hypothetical protein
MLLGSIFERIFNPFKHLAGVLIARRAIKFIVKSIVSIAS